MINRKRDTSDISKEKKLKKPMSKIEKKISNVIRFLKQKELIPIPEVVYSNKLLEGKTALITGGSSGIGLAIANEYVKNGCRVIIVGRDEDKLKTVVESLGDKAGYIKMDITIIDNIHDKVEAAWNYFPENMGIDILVNSAGALCKHSFWDVDEKDWDTVIDSNLKGTFFLSREVGRRMKEAKKKGHILNISSSSSVRPAWTPYQISKWGLQGFTKGLADIMLPYGIIVNAIAPGPTATPMLGKEANDSIGNDKYPAGRYSTPSEVAQLAVYLTSNLGDMIVGDTVYITGGSGLLDLHN